MTVIVGLVDSSVVYMGGDSAGVAGWDLTVRADSKVFRNGSALFGFTTSFRMGQLLRYKLILPEINTEDVFCYMTTVFIDSVRDCLKSGGWAKKENEREDAGKFLVGMKGHLFQVCDDYQVQQAMDGFDAIGCGDQIARGALFATRGQNPVDRINIALEAAERFSAGVRRPFTILQI